MRFLPLLAAFLLTACGTLPEPFYGNPGPAAEKLAIPPTPVLIIPTPNAALLGDSAQNYAQNLATALAAKGIPAIAGPAQPAQWRLVTTAALAGDSVIPHYTLIGPDQKTYGDITGTPADAATWGQAGPAQNLQAAEDTPALENLLNTVNARIQGADPNSLENRPARLFVTGVTGAPGDGDLSLARNLTEDLPKLGDDITTNPQNADFFVTGTVTTAPDANNQLLVTLTWKVFDARHQSIGQVSQLHDLDPSDISPYWGDVAAAAATEAAGGIHTVISNATLHRPGA